MRCLLHTNYDMIKTCVYGDCIGSCGDKNSELLFLANCQNAFISAMLTIGSLYNKHHAYMYSKKIIESM